MPDICAEKSNGRASEPLARASHPAMLDAACEAAVSRRMRTREEMDSDDKATKGWVTVKELCMGRGD